MRLLRSVEPSKRRLHPLSTFRNGYKGADEEEKNAKVIPLRRHLFAKSRELSGSPGELLAVLERKPGFGVHVGRIRELRTAYRIANLLSHKFSTVCRSRRLSGEVR